MGEHEMPGAGSHHPGQQFPTQIVLAQELIHVLEVLHGRRIIAVVGECAFITDGCVFISLPKTDMSYPGYDVRLRSEGLTTAPIR